MYPLASAIRYGPFFAGYWKSFVLLAHGAKHCASEFGAVTTLGGAAVAKPVATSAAAATTHVRYSIKASSIDGAPGAAGKQPLRLVLPASEIRSKSRSPPRERVALGVAIMGASARGDNRRRKANTTG